MELNTFCRPPLRAVSAATSTMATRAMIRPYSTIPWPLCRWSRSFRSATCLAIRVWRYSMFCDLPPVFGLRRGDFPDGMHATGPPHGFPFAGTADRHPNAVISPSPVREPRIGVLGSMWAPAGRPAERHLPEEIPIEGLRDGQPPT